MDEAELNEAKTRKMLIDKALGAAGWGPIVPYKEGTLCSHGSVEEYPTSKGPADYILFHQGKAIACVEGKKVKVAPMNVLQQAKRYARGFPSGPRSCGSFGEFCIPFIYSTNGKVHLVPGSENPAKSAERGRGFPYARGSLRNAQQGRRIAIELADQHSG